MHLGLQITATRSGVPEKYSREITDYYWDRLDGVLPDPEAFADLFEAGSEWSAGSDFKTRDPE
jgi:hypothetical protein